MGHGGYESLKVCEVVRDQGTGLEDIRIQIVVQAVQLHVKRDHAQGKEVKKLCFV